ncbi:hypothetical protein D3C85_1757020 [compost metagenome]
MSDELHDVDYERVLDQVTPIRTLIQQYQPQTKPEDSYFLTEFILWGLTLHNKLSKYRVGSGLQFQDKFQEYLRNNL